MLTPFEAYVLFHVVLWKGMSSFVPYTFGVSTATDSQPHFTHAQCCGSLPTLVGGKYQPYPSPDAMQRYCSKAARELLQLSEGTGHLLRRRD